MVHILGRIRVVNSNAAFTVLDIVLYLPSVLNPKSVLDIVLIAIQAIQAAWTGRALPLAGLACPLRALN